MKLILCLLILVGCSKQAITAPKAETVTTSGKISGIGPLTDTIVLTGLNLGLGDSLKRNLQLLGSVVYDNTEKEPNLDRLINTPLPAPANGVIIADALSMDVYQNRDTDKDYLARLKSYIEAMRFQGWKVIVILPRGVPVTSITPSGFSSQQYRVQLATITASIMADPTISSVAGRVGDITAKLLAK